MPSFGLPSARAEAGNGSVSIGVGGSLTLFALRVKDLESSTGFFALSREGALLVNNLFLVLMACVGGAYAYKHDAFVKLDVFYAHASRRRKAIQKEIRRPYYREYDRARGR